MYVYIANNKSLKVYIYLLIQRLLRPRFLESVINGLLCNRLSSMLLVVEIEV